MFGSFAGQAIPTCIPATASDGRDFGFSLSVGDGVVAIGDPSANRVTLLSRDGGGNWSRSGAVEAPAGSVFAELGSGFGHAVAVDGDRVVIGAYSERSAKAVGASPRWVNGLGTAYFGEVYVAGSGQGPVPLTTDGAAVPGFAVGAAAGRIAYSVKSETAPGVWSGALALVHQTTRSTIEAPADLSGDGFAFGFDIRADALLLSAKDHGGATVGLLYDLPATGGPVERRRFRAGAAGRFLSAVALADDTVVLSRSIGWNTKSSDVFAMSGSLRTTLDIGGHLSAGGTVLVAAIPGAADGETRVRAAVYDVAGDQPKLIKEIPGAIRAAVGGDTVAVTVRTDDRSEICLMNIQNGE